MLAKISMRRSITRSFILVFTLAMAISYIFLYMSIYSITLQDQKEVMESAIAFLDTEDLDSQKIKNYLDTTHMRITLIKSDGEVLLDTNPYTKENHLQRQEVLSAIESGSGSAIRYSNTLKDTYLYVARYDSDKDEILRLSMPFDGFVKSIQKLTPFFILTYILGLVIFWLLARKTAKAISAPLKDIEAKTKEAGNSYEPVIMNDYGIKEIQSIASSIEEMDKLIKSSLKNEKKEKEVMQQFFNNASHELKTPLTSIIGYSELISLNADSLDSQALFCVNQIQKESARMHSIVQDLLLISKIEAKETRKKPQPVHVLELLKSIEQSLKPTNTLNCTIHIDCSEDLVVMGIYNYLQAMVSNVISNALKYNRQRGHLYIKAYALKKDFIFICQDNGIGMSEEQRLKMFERFYRADEQHSNTIMGTGLGLTIVKSVVDFYKGKIETESILDKGTKITIVLPNIAEN